MQPPLAKQEIVTDPEQEVNKNVFMGKLHDMVNWGRKTSLGPTTSAFLAAMCRDGDLFTAVHDVARFGAEVLRAATSG